jgi:hypothetical protein
MKYLEIYYKNKNENMWYLEERHPIKNGKIDVQSHITVNKLKKDGYNVKTMITDED